MTTATYTLEHTRVIDGDTIAGTVNGLRATIRLAGIDAPELDQPFGPQAGAALNSLIPVDRRLHLRVDQKHDRHGRVVATLFIPHNRSDINQLMVEAGMAFHDHRHAPNYTQLATAQQVARNRRIGIWQHHPDGITRPWLHRQQQRKNPISFRAIAITIAVAITALIISYHLNLW